MCIPLPSPPSLSLSLSLSVFLSAQTLHYEQSTTQGKYSSIKLVWPQSFPSPWRIAIILEQIELFSLGMATVRGESQIWIQTTCTLYYIVGEGWQQKIFLLLSI